MTYSYQQINKRWVVNKIIVTNQPVCLGSFDDEEEAKQFIKERIENAVRNDNRDNDFSNSDSRRVRIAVRYEP